ncbi:MAG: hypothetical protein DRR19_32565, partial [Candidatus Parabeggiatoa sp. nov. 1]
FTIHHFIMYRYLPLFISLVFLITACQDETQQNEATSEAKSIESNASSTVIDNNSTPLALVIGNGDYQNVPLLANPVNDANDMAEVLKKLGFEVVLKLNVSRRAMIKAVQAFGQRLSNKSSIGLVYFSGHGLQSKNSNYLVPIDANIVSEAEIQSESVDANLILAQMGQANNQLNIVILDACRDNPYEIPPLKSLKKGLAEMKIPAGTLIAYATAPDTVTYGDSNERNSIYTKHLLTALRDNAHLSVVDLFTEVTIQVMAETEKKQVPSWQSASLTQRFCFGMCDQPIEVSKLLPVCETHFQANRLTSGRGGNALACYESVLKRDKMNVQALAGLEKIEARYVTWIEQALEQKQPELAKKQLAGLRQQNPDSPKLATFEDRLQSLNSQLSSQSATTAPAQKTSPESEVSRLLPVCEIHLNANRLMSGRGGNALACYEEVLNIDKTNAQALAGLENIEARYVTLITQTLEQKQLDKAKAYLASLGQVNPESPQLVALEAQLQSLSNKPSLAEQNPAFESALQACQAHFEANRLTTGEGGTALACYKEVLSKEPTNAKALSGLKNIEARYVTWIERALDKQQEKPAKQYLASLRMLNPESPKLVELEERLQSLARYIFVPGKIFRDYLQDGSLGPEMVWLPAERFQMGDIQNSGEADEKPVHWVSVNRFAMGRYEITFAEYDHFAEATNRKKPKDNGWGRGKRPVINVSWFDAIAYLGWLSQQTGQTYRLPTEAEREYAARAGTKTNYWWGDKIGSNLANCKGCGSQWDNKQTAPVGSFAPNPFGLHDTAGNVYEWTCSEYENQYSGKEQRCVKNASRLVLRGGSWNAVVLWARSAFRNRDKPVNGDNNVGFRLVSMSP